MTHNCISTRYILAAIVITLGCGGSGSSPSGPTSPGSSPLASGPSISTGTVVSLRSAETDQPVAGASISLAGQSQTGGFIASYTTDAGGQFTLDRTVRLSATPQLEATAPGFLTRSTILRADETTLSLWPASSPTGLDEAFSSETVYSASTCPAVNTGQSPLRKTASSAGAIQVSLGPDLQDASAEAAHGQAIARLNAALAGSPRYELAGSPGAGVSFTAVIDPGHRTCTEGSELLRAAAELTFTNGSISGGRLVYCSIAAARSVSLVLHELGHTFGLYHSSSSSDVMYCTIGRPSQFSARETLVMKLMRQRRAGNRWPDNDRQTAAPLALPARSTEVITCGGGVGR